MNKKLVGFIVGAFNGKVSTKNNDQKFSDNGDKTYAEFAAFYNERIRPKVASAEESRVTHLKQFYFRLKLSIPLCLVSLVLINTFLPINPSDKGFLDANILPFVALSIWCYQPFRSFESKIKSEIFSEIFKFFGDFKYSHKGMGKSGVDLREKFGIIPSYSSVETEDLVIGNYSDVSITFEEWKLVRGSGKHRKTVFEGATILLGFNKNFLGKTVIRRDSGKIGNFASKIADSDLKGLEKVNFEDPEFEKKFEVFSSDQIEARYLITPAFMERLKNLTKFFNADSVIAGFSDNSLFLMFEGAENLFEVGSMFEEINLIRDSKRAVKQMNLIFELIDYLKINQRTGV